MRCIVNHSILGFQSEGDCSYEEEVHVYLKKSVLIVPPGQVPMTGLLVTALHHVTELKGVPIPAINAIHAVAFLLEEIEECALHQTI